ncbi:TetR/AcrR family transcriptional regulator [Microbispora sp. NBRC 16548]|uniref:TetR/AcrR family transcriptional regulator n=1 Tax=Microbispora sp. NBRC 16548 TaxID=3030994 RepID=UPI0024A06BD5|nr:TetR/AcrR family transcriptional regulator [Microbispora sp. NBRC 16548]GLX04815.1 TetR family transcriptional regulator [Microbispora sp. NBRC 16548]
MSTPQARRKTRADAERNRDRVLEAARALFAESGYDVQMSEVARAAGVGIGTLYRKFPTREALIEAIAEHRAADIIAAARRLTDADDPAQGLARFLHHVGEVLSDDRGMSEVIEKAMGSSEPREETREALLAIAAELIDRAQARGTVGHEVTTGDVNMIICGLAAVIRNAAGDWRRYIEVALDGLRPR